MTLLFCALAAAVIGATVGRWWLLWLSPFAVVVWAAAVALAKWPADMPVAFLALLTESALAVSVLWRRRFQQIT